MWWHCIAAKILQMPLCPRSMLNRAVLVRDGEMASNASDERDRFLQCEAEIFNLNDGSSCRVPSLWLSFGRLLKADCEQSLHGAGLHSASRLYRTRKVCSDSIASTRTCPLVSYRLKKCWSASRLKISIIQRGWISPLELEQTVHHATKGCTSLGSETGEDTKRH